MFLDKKLGETVGQSNESTPATASSSPTVHPAAGKRNISNNPSQEKINKSYDQFSSQKTK